MVVLSDSDINQILNTAKVRGPARLAAKSALGRFSVNGNAQGLKTILRTQAGSLTDAQREKIVRMAQDMQRGYLQRKHVRASRQFSPEFQRALEAEVRRLCRTALRAK